MNDEPRPEPAHRPPPTNGTTDALGEEVKTVAKSRRPGRKRAWDEMSEIDRAVLLETVRQRRRAEAIKRSVEAEVYRSRSMR